MSCDLERLQSASGLRAWEEGRVKNFTSWRLSVESLIAGLRTTVGLGVMQQQRTEEFLRHRCAADLAYAQGLVAPPASAPPSPTLEKGKTKDAPASASGKSKAPAAPQQKDLAQTFAEVAQAIIPSDPFVNAISEIQKRMSAAREAFANQVMEGLIVSALGKTTEDFESRSGTLLQGLDSGLAEAIQAHSLAVEAMTAYHRSSIEGSREDPPVDAWLFEHKYRRAVEALRQRQRDFTAQLCSTVDEIWQLEEWREEMSVKVLGGFCKSLHQIETQVQSFSNDAIRAHAGHKKEDSPSAAILADLDQLLRSQPPPPNAAPPPQASPSQGAQPSQKQAAAKAMQARPADGQWPMLLRLRDQGQLGPLPPSVLSVLRGPLQARGRWYGSQLSMVVLTKDFYLHCFPIALEKASGSSAPSGVPIPKAAAKAAVSAQAASISIEAVEADPSWSLYIPGANISRGGGKSKSIEVEEVKRGFLGIKTSTRQTLQADDEGSLQRWINTLQQASQKKVAELSDARPSQQRKPPPPPPPQRPVTQAAVPPAPPASAAFAVGPPQVASTVSTQPSVSTQPRPPPVPQGPAGGPPPATLSALLKPQVESVFA